MCGIVGSLAFAEQSPEQLRAEAMPMADAIRHRGPDDLGVHVEPAAGLVFGHCRLAVVDPSPDGHQPMVSADGRWILNYNGEVYNHRALRRQLEAEGASFRGYSDTEVLLEAVARWGHRQALEKTDGMLALALWDRRERRLILACDRMGEKPLYYGLLKGRLAFASELKALREHSGFVGGVDPAALAAYLRRGYVPAPLSIHPGILKLPAGHLLEVAVGASSPRALPEPDPYWHLDAVVQAALLDPVVSTEEALAELERLLSDSVTNRMVADVPVGALLSGGVDSSLVVALMRESGAGSVKTFTIGFEDSAYDESGPAREVAELLGTEHTELRLSAAQTLETVPALPQIFDEPFADSSQIPTLLVSQLARTSVTVALTGDGGDELFSGYSRYLLGDGLWPLMQRVPAPLRAPLSRGLRSVSAGRWDSVYGWIAPLLPARHRASRPGQKLHRLSSILAAPSFEAAYKDLMSLWRDPGVLVPVSGDAEDTAGSLERWLPGAGIVDRVTSYDAATYLPGDLLVKVDRAAMAASLETRLPLLSCELVAFAWRIPQAMKLRGGVAKWPLRELLRRRLPDALVDRPKMGFGVPVGEWLRGPLKPWGEDLLTPDSLSRDGLLDSEAVRAVWSSHLAGHMDHSGPLWAVLMYQAWRQDVETTVP